MRRKSRLEENQGWRRMRKNRISIWEEDLRR